MRTRKVGIVTFHRAYNYGAVLQAYALCQYVNEHACAAEIIDYYPNNYVPPRINRLRKVYRLIKRVVKGTAERKKQIKYRKFEEFARRYVLSEMSYFGDSDIKKAPPCYDVFISGSDQILNTTLTGKSETYYLSFVGQGRKISYASSFGREDITDDEKRFIKEYLKGYYALSVREESGREIIANEIGENVTEVVDPVFLLTQDEWRQMTYDIMDKEYILIYAMENSPHLSKTVEAVQRYYKLPTIIILGGEFKPDFEGDILFDCGPEDYLSYLQKATVVVTNSFHGSAFSIIFEKRLICVAHTLRNTRIKNIMRLLDSQDKIIYDDGKNINVESSIIETKNKSKLVSMIQCSQDYLLQNLRE